MFDKILVRITKGPLEVIARGFVRLRIHSTWVTLANIPIAIAIFISILFELYLISVILILVNRLFDGLDGTLARYAHTDSVAGGYLDIVVDYIFYASIPLAHGLLSSRNVLGACLVLFAYVLSGVQFMASSSSAHKLGINSKNFPQKKIYYPVHIVEGFETILYSLAVTLFPMSFPTLSYIMAFLLLVTLPIIVLRRYKEFQSVERQQSKDK